MSWHQALATVEQALIWGAVGRLLLLRPLHRLLQVATALYIAYQREIADHLDTRTPGGLADLVSGPPSRP